MEDISSKHPRSLLRHLSSEPMFLRTAETNACTLLIMLATLHHGMPQHLNRTITQVPNFPSTHRKYCTHLRFPSIIKSIRSFCRLLGSSPFARFHDWFVLVVKCRSLAGLVQCDAIDLPYLLTCRG